MNSEAEAHFQKNMFASKTVSVTAITLAADRYLITMQRIFFFLLFASLFFLQGFFAQAYASTLYFSPSSGERAVGTTFSVGIYVSSIGQAMNAASGVVSFPTDALEVVSVSIRGGSIISLWVREPSFSNSAGTVSFEGIVLNPGFTGPNGRIITVTFRAKAAGAATLRFSSGSVLANDGQGTNILASMGDARFFLNQAARAVPPAPEERVVANVPPAPTISSPTHPDPDTWYSLNRALFRWNLPEGVNGVRLLVGREPNAVPTVAHIPPISERELTDLEDGVWYLSARLRNAAGWGGIARFRFQIDTENPSRFEIQEVERADPTDPRARFIFRAEDETSGIESYEARINNESPQIVRDDGDALFEAPVLGPGKHTIIVRALDRARNYLTDSAEFFIEPLSAPNITEYPETLRRGEVLRVRGTTVYPNAEVVLWLARGNDGAKRHVVVSDEGGNFIFVTMEGLKDGTYTLWAEVIDGRGARSLPTEKITITVREPMILEMGVLVVVILSLVVTLIALIVLLLLIVLYGWRKFAQLKRSVRKEVSEAETALEKSFILLRAETLKQIKMLERTRGRRKLTYEEEEIIAQFKKNLEDAEELVRKEIGDIRKEME
jgi:hypothetical protein